MKLSLIVAVAVLALAQGSFAQDAANLGQYLEDMKTKVTQELNKFLESQDLSTQAQTLQAQLEPIAAQVQEQLKTVATNFEQQVKPMAAGMQEQLQPMLDNFKQQMETLVQTMTAQAKAIAN